MFADILLAVPLGILLAFTIGPVFFVLLETAITKGFRAAIAFNTGVVTADAAFIAIVYFTTNSLLTEIKDDPRLFLAGGLIMMAYGLLSFIKVKKDFQKDVECKDNISFIRIKKVNYKGFLLNFINIGVLGFWLGIIVVFGPKLDMEPNRILLFFSSIIIVYFLIDIGKILIAKKLKNRLTAYHIYKIKRVISIILLLFGVFLVCKPFFLNVLSSLKF